MVAIPLLVMLLVLLVSALPAWPYSRAWGYYPSSVLGMLLLIVLLLVLMGRVLDGAGATAAGALAPMVV
jgi:hypothetical protein